MKILKFNSLKDPNIGLYNVCNDNIAITGLELDDKEKKELKDSMDVEIYKISVLRTNLVGIFTILTNDYLLYPSALYDDEKEALKKIASDIGIEHLEINTKYTAIGNIIAINGKRILISDNLDKSIYNELRDLGFNVNTIEIPYVDVVGQLIVTWDNLAIISPLIDENTEQDIVKYLKIKKYVKTTVNFANPFVRSGILMNEKAILVGRTTTGPELANLSELIE